MVPCTGVDLRLPSSFRVVPAYTLMKRLLVPVIFFEYLYDRRPTSFRENRRSRQLGESTLGRLKVLEAN